MGSDSFNVGSTSDFRALVVWLEDQKIRHYPIEERAALRQVDSPDWDITFQKYLADNSCPPQISSDRKSTCEWLLGLAVRLEYSDNAEKYNTITGESVLSMKKKAPEIIRSNPLDNLDFESDDFKAGVISLAKMLKVIPHPDHLVTLRAVSRVIRKYLSRDAIKNKEYKSKGGKSFPLEESKLGFDTNDPVMNMALKTLRLLYVQDLRDLQTRINETIVAVQSVTANPKTDTRLGKVGR